MLESSKQVRNIEDSAHVAAATKVYPAVRARPHCHCRRHRHPQPRQIHQSRHEREHLTLHSRNLETKRKHVQARFVLKRILRKLLS